MYEYNNVLITNRGQPVKRCIMRLEYLWHGT